MKKILVVVLVLAGFTSFSQSLDVHYDFERECVTTTMEMFRPDNLGNTFFFIDMDYYDNDIEGINLAYWEIARVFQTKKMPVGINVEYNGGFGRFKTPTGAGAFSINEAWLTGITYSINAKDFSKSFTVKAQYKHIRYIDNVHSFQLTGVWYYHFLKKKMTFKGFADLWQQDDNLVFLSEPQLWYHVHKHFDVGGEVELSNNFAGTDGFAVRPTLAVKWKF